MLHPTRHNIQQQQQPQQAHYFERFDAASAQSGRRFAYQLLFLHVACKWLHVQS